MKTREIKELQTKSISELRTQLAEAKQALAASRLEHAQRKLTNTTGLTTQRHDIARIETVLRSKHTQEGGGA